MKEEKIKLLYERKKLLNLHAIEITNKEWLYMLGEETRNSIMIEGIFFNEEELENAIEGKYKSASHVTNYFKTAKFVYNLAFEMYKAGEELQNCIALIRTIHRMIFENILRPSKLGNFRKGKIKIIGAKIEPPEFDIEDWIRLWCEYSKYAFKNLPIYEAAARSHVFFESIHPFEDGNGRVGRILLNFLLIQNGFVNIIIKGESEKERNMYIKSLEKAEKGIRNIFKSSPSNIEPHFLDSLFKNEDTKDLSNIIFEGLIRSIDRYISSNETEFIDTNTAAKILGIKNDSVLKLIKRGKLIAVKKGKWYIPKRYLNLFR